MDFNSRRQHRKKCQDFKGFTCLTHPKSMLSCWIRTKESKSQGSFINEESKNLGEAKSDDGERKMESPALAPNRDESCQSCSPVGEDSSGDDALVPVYHLLCEGFESELGNLRELTSFNLGIGFGLVYLLTESKDELNKIKDLHKEMEVGLRSLKDKLVIDDQAQTKGVGSLRELESSLSLRDPLIRSFTSRQPSMKKMNLLEEELVAELEQLQLHIESGRMIYQEERYSEIVVEDTAQEGNLYTTNYEEIVDPPPQMTQNEEQYGVSPYELERRLHELLEARQQERINELEEALHCATQKIQEKERKLSWWKDAAKLFFQDVPVHNERLALTYP